ncbi:MAG: DNA translocase FtsK [Clostridia bacterium]|nr:DNA translocase FtsK [Clostridia bacterium]
MAEDKKKKTQSSSKKNTNTKSQPKKKRMSKAEMEQLRIEEEIRQAEYIKKRNQTFALIVFAVSLALFSIVLIPASQGTVWHSIRGFFFGLFGYSAFFLPAVLIYTAIMMTLEKLEQSIGKKIFQGVLLVFFVSALGFVIGHKGEISFGTDIGNAFTQYFNYSTVGWGFFGALIGELLLLIGSSKAPAVAILVILIFVAFMFLTGFTLIRIIKGLEKPAKKVGDKIEQVKQEYAEREEKNESSKDKKRGHLYVYTEDDLLTTPDEEVKAQQPAAEVIPVDIPVEEEETVIETAEAVQTDETAEIKDIFALAAEKQAAEEEKKLTKSEIESAQESVAEEIQQNEQEEEDNYMLPPFDCLRLPVRNTRTASQADLKATADKLIEALNSFNVSAKVIDVVPGPSVTRYELAPAPGVKISKFTGLADDLALHLAAPAGVRIEAPIPNKSAIGIEVPNRGRTTVTMREIVDSDIYSKATAKSKLNVALGKDIAGNIVCADLAKMPHILIAGTTGSGKSVCLNAMIVSILYNAKPGEVKLLLIDPKQVEFAVYNGIPHLLVPVVSDARKAAGALGWAVTEMLNRYKTFTDNGVRDISSYNKMAETDTSLQKMSQIVIFIDELSDLMSVAPSEVENSITRLAQMARAAGMHLVVATQRPSVDVITGLIKANIPSRLALSVSSQVDSRTILDASGAEKLLGLGDMLFCPVGTSKPHRVQGCYLSDEEIEKVVEFVKTQETTSYSDDIQQEIDRQALSAAPKKGAKESDGGAVSDADMQIIMKAAELVIDNPDKASISSLQRHLSLGFAKAGRIMDALEEKGIVGPHSGSKPRKVLMTKAQWYEMNAMASDAPATDADEEDAPF